MFWRETALKIHEGFWEYSKHRHLFRVFHGTLADQYKKLLNSNVNSQLAVTSILTLATKLNKLKENLLGTQHCEKLLYNQLKRMNKRHTPP